MTTILKAKPVTDKIYKDLKKRIKKGVELGRDCPKLLIITIGDDEASKVYVRKKVEMGKELGIDVEHQKYHDFVTESTLKTHIEYFTEFYDGIILQLPLPESLKHIDTKTLIPPHLDVDGFHPLSDFKPCTPLGVMKLLEHYEIPVAGKDVCIIGRSVIVGKPLAQMMTDADATVTLCHSRTRDLNKYTEEADIVISAVGKPGLIIGSMLKDAGEVVLIDVGINRLPNGKLCGDMDISDIEDWADGPISDEVMITPVPGGVGPMTIAMLMSNVVESWERE